MTLLDRVKQLATQKKMTLSELERKLDFSNGSLSKWSSVSPSGDRLKKVADYFNVSVDYLLDRDDRPYYERLTAKDERSIQKKLEEMIENIDGMKFSKEEGEFSEETRELLINALEHAVRITKIEAKKRYTPKKYRD